VLGRETHRRVQRHAAQPQRDGDREGRRRADPLRRRGFHRGRPAARARRKLAHSAQPVPQTGDRDLQQRRRRGNQQELRDRAAVGQGPQSDEAGRLLPHPVRAQRLQAAVAPELHGAGNELQRLSSSVHCRNPTPRGHACSGHADGTTGQRRFSWSMGPRHARGRRAGEGPSHRSVGHEQEVVDRDGTERESGLQRPDPPEWLRWIPAREAHRRRDQEERPRACPFRRGGLQGDGSGAPRAPARVPSGVARSGRAASRITE
jgi:hypothetical protein